MATPTQLRSDVAVLTRAAELELAPLWREVATALALEEVLRDILPALIDQYGAAAATLAADWYDDARAEAGVRGTFRAIPADIPDSGAQALVGWALVEVANPADVSAFRSLIEGGTQRRIVNFSRGTVMRSSVADPQSDGWQRVATSKGCPFCRMLAGRAILYRSESSADFGAHDHCSCEAIPAWGGEARPVKPYVPSLRYDDTPAGRAKKAKDQARVRDWIASH